MGKVQNAVQFHVDDGDVQVAERICRGREQNLSKIEIDSVANRTFISVWYARSPLIVQ